MTAATMEATAVRMLAVCPRCKTAHAEDVPAVEASEFFYLTSCQGGGQTAHRSCRECGRGLHRWSSVRGKVNAAVKCNARCTGARRSDCECECGGHNHGSDNR